MKRKEIKRFVNVKRPASHQTFWFHIVAYCCIRGEQIVVSISLLSTSAIIESVFSHTAKLIKLGEAVKLSFMEVLPVIKNAAYNLRYRFAGM
jgi:hypothetical protein